MIELIIHSEDSEEIELAKRYWGMNEEGAFRERTRALLPFHEITNAYDLVELVNRASTAWDLHCGCPVCGGAEVYCRSELLPGPSRAPCRSCKTNAREAKRKRKERTAADFERCLSVRTQQTLATTLDYQRLSDDHALLLLAVECATSRSPQDGFRLKECEGLVPGEAGYFIDRLHRAMVIVDDPRRARPKTYYQVEGQISFHRDGAQYFLPPDVRHGVGKKALAVLHGHEFRDAHALHSLWLEYAADACMWYFNDQCNERSLYVSDEDKALVFSALYTAARIHCMRQLWFATFKVISEACVSAAISGATAPSVAVAGSLIRLLDDAARGRCHLGQWHRPRRYWPGALGCIFSNDFRVDEDVSGSDALAIFMSLEQVPGRVETWP